jgi:hypothetical protein
MQKHARSKCVRAFTHLLRACFCNKYSFNCVTPNLYYIFPKQKSPPKSNYLAYFCKIFQLYLRQNDFWHQSCTTYNICEFDSNDLLHIKFHINLHIDIMK